MRPWETDDLTRKQDDKSWFGKLKPMILPEGKYIQLTQPLTSAHARNKYTEEENIFIFDLVKKYQQELNELGAEFLRNNSSSQPGKACRESIKPTLCATYISGLMASMVDFLMQKKIAVKKLDEDGKTRVAFDLILENVKFHVKEDNNTFYIYAKVDGQIYAANADRRVPIPQLLPKKLDIGRHLTLMSVYANKKTAAKVREQCDYFLDYLHTSLTPPTDLVFHGVVDFPVTTTVVVLKLKRYQPDDFEGYGDWGDTDFIPYDPKFVENEIFRSAMQTLVNNLEAYKATVKSLIVDYHNVNRYPASVDRYHMAIQRKRRSKRSRRKSRRRRSRARSGRSQRH